MKPVYTLPPGAPFRYKGRTFYRGDPNPESLKPFKRQSTHYRVYEVVNRCLDYTNVYTLERETLVTPVKI